MYVHIKLQDEEYKLVVRATTREEAVDAVKKMCEHDEILDVTPYERGGINLSTLKANFSGKMNYKRGGKSRQAL